MKQIINPSQASDSCVEIHCGDDQGTGFVISKDKILTAYHVVVDCDNEKISARISNKFKECSVLYFSVEFDLCILSCEGLNLNALPLEDSIIRIKESCQIHGYPFKSASSSRILSLNGKIGQILKDDASDFIINEIDIDSNFDYEGLSGAPVIIEGKVAGIIRRQLNDRLSMISVHKASEFFKDNDIEFEINIPRFDIPHGFTDQVTSSRPNREVINRLDDALNTDKSWFLLHGSPGSGKSTIAASFSPKQKTIVVICRYFVKIPNDNEPLALRKSKTYFLDYLESMCSIILTGQRLPKEELSFDERLVRLSELLKYLGAYYSEKRETACVIIDGLDEVPMLEEFLGILPLTLPQNIKIILSSTSIQILPSAYKNLLSEPQIILVTPLIIEQCEGLIIEELEQKLVSMDAVQSLAHKSEGHPLYLRYLINFLKNSDESFFNDEFEDWLEKIPVIHGDITNYYNSLWDKFYENPSKLWNLIIFSQLRQPISVDEAYQILPQTFQLTFTSNFESIKFLLAGTTHFEIYHNSFKRYVNSKTTVEEPLANDYICGYMELNPNTDFSLNNLLYHYSKSSNKSLAVEACTQSWADNCAINDIAPDLVLEDIKRVIALSIEFNNANETIRLLLLLQRIDFRYDSVFTEHANLIAQSLISVGKFNAAIKYLVRDSDLIIGNYDAIFFLQLFYENMAFEEAQIIYSGIQKRYRKFIEEASRSTNGIRLDMFGVIIKAHALSANDDKKEGFENCMSILSMLGRMEKGARENNEQEAADALQNLREQNASWIQAYFLRRFDFFTDAETVKDNLKIELDEVWANLRALSILIFDELNEYNIINIEKGAQFDSLVLDLEHLITNYSYKEENIGVILAAIMPNSKNSQLVSNIITKRPIEDRLFDLRAENGVDLNYQAVYDLFFSSQCNGYTTTTEDYPELYLEEYRYSTWEKYVKSIIENLGFIEGKLWYCRASGLPTQFIVTQLLKVLDIINFSLNERVHWERVYHLPENVFPIIYSKIMEIAMGFASELIESVHSKIILRIDDQLGLYSEGFRKTLHELAKSLVKTKQLSPLMQVMEIWENHVIANVQNRWERTPELLKIMEIYGVINNQEKAFEIFEAMLRTSMGPSWYKEDQLALIGRVMSLPQTEIVNLADLKVFAGQLDFASGEMTFQRYVRHEKEHYIGGLIRNGQLEKALDYYKFEVLPSSEQVIKNAELYTIDAPKIGHGYILGAGNLTEERGILEIIENAQISSPQLLWALAQVFIINTDIDRYDKQYSELLGKSLNQIVLEKPEVVGLILPTATNIAVKLQKEGDLNYYLQTLFQALNQENKVAFQALLREKDIEYDISIQVEQIEQTVHAKEPETDIAKFNIEAERLKDISSKRLELLNQGVAAFAEKKYMIWHGNYSGENSDARKNLKKLFITTEEILNYLKPFIVEFDETHWVVVSQLLWFLEEKLSAEQTKKMFNLIADHFNELIHAEEESMNKYNWIESTSPQTQSVDEQIAFFLIWLMNHPADWISEGAYKSICLLCETDPYLIIPILIKQALSRVPTYSSERASFILKDNAQSQQKIIQDVIGTFGIASFANIAHFTIHYNFYKIALIIKESGDNAFYDVITANIPATVAPTSEVDMEEEFLESIEWNISRLNELHLLDKTFCETLIGTINNCVSPLTIEDFIKGDEYIQRSFYESTYGPTRFEYIVKHALNIAITHRVSIANIDEIFDEINY